MGHLGWIGVALLLSLAVVAQAEDGWYASPDEAVWIYAERLPRAVTRWSGLPRRATLVLSMAAETWDAVGVVLHPRTGMPVCSVAGSWDAAADCTLFTGCGVYGELLTLCPADAVSEE